VSRVAVPLPHAYRLINHGPTTLVTSAHAGRANVMAAQWVMPLDFDPPIVAVVVDRNTFTRTLIDASRELALSIPTRAQIDLVATVGSASGAEVDKLAALAVATSPGERVAAPLVDGCAAWLECRCLDQRALEAAHDLFLVEVVAASADDASWRNERWDFPDDDHRTLHHYGGGVFALTGATVRGKRLL
jgi:flavin reductase (DIM6/NTAB) family NADH-FMN oxidoreductase RutF